MGWFPLCATVSMVITVHGHRGVGDPRPGPVRHRLHRRRVGASAVRRAAETPPRCAKLLSEDDLPDLAISDVRIAGQESGLRFDINTSEPDMEKVQQARSPKCSATSWPATPWTFTPPTVIEAKATETRRTTPPANRPKTAPPKGSRRRKRPRRKKPPGSGAAECREEAGPVAEQGPIAPRLAVEHDAGGGRPEAVMLAMADEPAEDRHEKPVGGQTGRREAGGAKRPPVEPVAVPSQSKAGPAQAGDARREAREGQGRRGRKAEPSSPWKPAPIRSSAEPSSHLTFKLELNHGAVEQLVNSAIEAAKLASQSLTFSVSNADYTAGDQPAYQEWDLKIMRRPRRPKAC